MYLPLPDADKKSDTIWRPMWFWKITLFNWKENSTSPNVLWIIGGYKIEFWKGSNIFWGRGGIGKKMQKGMQMQILRKNDQNPSFLRRSKDSMFGFGEVMAPLTPSLDLQIISIILILYVRWIFHKYDWFYSGAYFHVTSLCYRHGPPAHDLH